MPDDNWLTLGEEQLDRLADLLAIKLAATGSPRRQMLTVYDICATFQVSRAWVYEFCGMGSPRLARNVVPSYSVR